MDETLRERSHSISKSKNLYGYGSSRNLKCHHSGGQR